MRTHCTSIWRSKLSFSSWLHLELPFPTVIITF